MPVPVNPVARIDAHQHFWRIERGDYHWMTDAVAPIRRDILPSDLAPLLTAQGIDGTVAVQAAATVAETKFLIDLAAEHDTIKGVVGWVDLDDADAPATLDVLRRFPVFKGVRPMLQAIVETDWIERPCVLANLAELATRGLRLDALIVPRHLDVLARVAERLPGLPIVIDHCAKPAIAGGADAGDAWRKGMAHLASFPNLHCKISGLANEAGPGWNAEWLKPVVDHVLHHFEPRRTMWGSDWPVLDLAGDYDRWCDVSDVLLEGLSEDDRAAVHGGTATRFYGLTPLANAPLRPIP